MATYSTQRTTYMLVNQAYFTYVLLSPTSYAILGSYYSTWLLFKLWNSERFLKYKIRRLRMSRGTYIHGIEVGTVTAVVQKNFEIFRTLNSKKKIIKCYIICLGIVVKAPCPGEGWNVGQGAAQARASGRASDAMPSAHRPACRRHVSARQVPCKSFDISNLVKKV